MNLKRIKSQGKLFDYVILPIGLTLLSFGMLGFYVWRKIWHNEEHIWAIWISGVSAIYFKISCRRVCGDEMP